MRGLSAGGPLTLSHFGPSRSSHVIDTVLVDMRLLTVIIDFRLQLDIVFT